MRTWVCRLMSSLTANVFSAKDLRGLKSTYRHAKLARAAEGLQAGSQASISSFESSNREPACLANEATQGTSGSRNCFCYVVEEEIACEAVRNPGIVAGLQDKSY